VGAEVTVAVTQQRGARLSIDVSPDVRRRIRVAAARRDQSIRDYVWQAIEARLNQDAIDDPPGEDLVSLNQRADPVLGELWNNPKDAGYDDL
jgi:uncharacterized protein (DUF1778 family)